MKKYVISFLHRGLIFGGFGPVIMGIVYLIISKNLGVNFSGLEIFLAIISTYLLAFIQAGASIFNQIEGWSVLKSVTFHLGSIYIAYLSCYLVNIWIPFEWLVVLIFTIIFILTYFIIWLTVYLITRKTAKEMNKKIN